MTPIEKRMVETGFRQTDIAKGTGLNRARISLIVRGIHKPNKTEKRLISGFLGKPEKDLFPRLN